MEFKRLEWCMRVFYFISILAVATGLMLANGLGEAQAQDLAPDVSETARCGGALLAVGVIRHRQTDDEVHFLHGIFLAEAAASAIYKELHGEVPKGEVLASIEDLIFQSTRDFFTRNDGFRSQVEHDKLYKEALNCYQDLLGFMSERGLEILSKSDVIDVFVRALRHHMNYLAEYLGGQ
jgi:hypothetical protein